MLNKADNSVMEESLLNPMEFMQTYRQHLMNKGKLQQKLKQLQSQLNDKVWELWEGQIADLKSDTELLENEERNFVKAFRACKSAIPAEQMTQLFNGMQRFMNEDIAKLVPSATPPNTRAAPVRRK